MEKKSVRIMLTSVGRRVELVQAFHAAAERIGIELTVYGVDISLTAPAMYFCDRQFQICRISHPDYIAQLRTLCGEQEIDALIPTIDTDLLLLAEHKGEFEETGTRVYISEPDKVRLCRDKRLTGEFFESCGLRAPKAYGELAQYPDAYPAFVKPLDGSSSIDAYRVSDRKELETCCNKIGGYVIQPFIEGTEYTIDIFCNYDTAPVYITPRERMAVRSGEVLQTRICQNDEMIAEMQQLIKAFRPCGQITVQLIRQKETNVDYYIEINPRFGGGAPLSMKAGADSAAALLLDVAGRPLAYQPYAAADDAIYSRFDQSICIRKGTNRRV